MPDNEMIGQPEKPDMLPWGHPERVCSKRYCDEFFKGLSPKQEMSKMRAERRELV